MEVGEEGEYIYIYRYTVTTRMTSAFKMGSDESHFNDSLIVRDKVTRPCPQTTTLWLNFLQVLLSVLRYQLTY